MKQESEIRNQEKLKYLNETIKDRVQRGGLITVSIKGDYMEFNEIKRRNKS